MNTETLDMDHLKQWIGRQETSEDVITLAPIKALSATLDRVDDTPQSGDTVPVPWHWLYFLPSPLSSDLAVDGHPPKGLFLPPVPLPKRMWAGGSIEAFDLPKIGEKVTRISTVSDVKHKSGATGELVFVTVVHEIFANGRLAIRERQDLVYREESRPGAPVAKLKAAPENALWSRKLTATPPLLFRYSALTFNSHRIHYDKDYATEVEGYDDLVVHGPLLATFLLDLLRCHNPTSKLVRFDYRAVRPMMANHDFWVEGDVSEPVETQHEVSVVEEKPTTKVKLWTRDFEGAITMSADAYIANN